MGIDHKDEYATLRQEMLERFERIHQVTKWGITVFIAFLSYYYAQKYQFDDVLALLILELITALMGLYVLNLYERIYTEGTYIELNIEEGREAKWHRMSRGYDEYLQKINRKIWEYFPFPIGHRWGSDSALSAYLVLALTVIAFSVVFLKVGDLRELKPICFPQWVICIICAIFIIFNFILFYKLLLGMKNFRKRTKDRWSKYSEEIGNGPVYYND